MNHQTRTPSNPVRLISPDPSLHNAPRTVTLVRPSHRATGPSYVACLLTEEVRGGIQVPGRRTQRDPSAMNVQGKTLAAEHQHLLLYRQAGLGSQTLVPK